MEGKVCTKCKQWKLLEEFNKCKQHKDGRRYDCRECQKKCKKQYRENNAERIKEYNKQYEEKNAEYIKQYKKQYRENNKEYIKEANKQYRKENAEHIKEHKKQYYQDNKENNLQNISNIVEQINPILKNIPVYGYVYKIKNIKTGRCYIGQTTKPLKYRYKSNIIQGWIEERKEKQSQKFLDELIEEDFIVTELFDVAFCKWHLDKLETYWINHYDSYNNGYNNNAGYHDTNDGLEEFNRLLSTHNLEYKDNKIIKKPTSTNEID
jgi:hypothetical protein